MKNISSFMKIPMNSKADHTLPRTRSWASVGMTLCARAFRARCRLPFIGPIEISRKVVVYGAFKGMGDLLCATPIIESELNAGVDVILLVFPSLKSFADLVDFGSYRNHLTIVTLPVPFRLRSFRMFLSLMRSLSPDLVWYSPHSPIAVSSWRIPLLLSVTKFRYWPRAKFVGALSERLSWLFDIRLSVDRTLPYEIREQTAYALLDPRNSNRTYSAARFVQRIQNSRGTSTTYDLLIHPGASASNRQWPFAHYRNLLRELPMHWRIAVVGLQADVTAIQAELVEDKRVEFIVGSLENAIICIARAKFVLTMDSGPMFFAKALGIPAISLFGPSDPARVVEPSETLSQIFNRQWPCQPCMTESCRYRDVRCMHSIDPALVSSEIRRRMA